MASPTSLADKCPLSDAVFFYCHQSVLRTKSSNSFGYLLPPPIHEPTGPQSTRSMPSSISPETWMPLTGPSSPNASLPSPNPLPPRSQSAPAQTDSLFTIFVQEESVVFNIVLHMVYGM